MLVHWIWLSTRPGMHDRARAALLEKLQDIDKIYRGKAEDYAQVASLRPEDVTALLDKDLTEAEEILRTAAAKKLKILTWGDEAYPKRLKNIPDPPVVLYYKGKLPDFDSEAAIGVVGTRKASAYGLKIAERIGGEIARCGGLVVSGLASGIDAAAMQGAVSEKVPTVGVLGCGADRIYPSSNRAVYAGVLEDGCILSEFPPGTKPFRWNFPKRNRIISGLSCGVLVVEASEVSGALITARQAADQGRDVFVVPGNVDTASCAGSNALLRDGAIAISNGWELLSEYEALYPDKIRKVPRKQKKETPKLSMLLDLLREENEAQPEEKQPISGKTAQKDIDNPPSGAYIDPESLTPEQRCIVTQLAGGPKLLDAVIAESALPTAKALSALTLLEIQGIAERLPGKKIGLKQH